MKVHAVLGATGIGKTSLATRVGLDLDAPVVVADRIQCYRDIPIVSSRPAPSDGTRIYLDDRTIADGDLHPAKAYSLLRRTLCRLGRRHQVVILEGGSISLLTMLFSDLPHLGFELHADVLSIDGGFGERTRLRVLDAMDRGLLAEFGRAWEHTRQRDFVRSIAGFDVLGDWCMRNGRSPEELGSLTGAEVADIADEMAEQAVMYAARQANALSAVGVRALGEGRDQCCRAVAANLARMVRVIQ